LPGRLPKSHQPLPKSLIYRIIFSRADLIE
jgi:hypothetical protein